MVYKYRAYTLDRKIVEGTINAASESMAEGVLFQAGYQRILNLREVRPKLTLAALVPTLFGIKTRDVVEFSQQLATLIESGVPILTALQLLEGQASRDALREVITGLIEEVRGGGSLSQAFGRYPQAFSDTYCQVIRASEHAGNLEVGLRQVSGYLEKQMATRQRITRALAYPAFVLLMAVGVFVLLVAVALPPLVKLFTTLGAELPWTTRIVIAIAGFLTDYAFYLLGAILVLVILLVGYLRLPAGKRAMDRLMLQIPVIGAVNIESNMFQFCQTTSILLQAGLRLPQIMDIAIQTIKNGVIRQALRQVRVKLVQGEGLSPPMATLDLFPRLLVEMVAVGEKTGTMDSTLATLADYYERRVDQKIGTLTAIIEPFMTAVIGLVVLFIALSLITPLYSILRSM